MSGDVDQRCSRTLFTRHSEDMKLSLQAQFVNVCCLATFTCSCFRSLLNWQGRVFVLISSNLGTWPTWNFSHCGGGGGGEGKGWKRRTKRVGEVKWGGGGGEKRQPHPVNAETTLVEIILCLQGFDYSEYKFYYILFVWRYPIKSTKWFFLEYFTGWGRGGGIKFIERYEDRQYFFLKKGRKIKT